MVANNFISTRGIDVDHVELLSEFPEDDSRLENFVEHLSDPVPRRTFLGVFPHGDTQTPLRAKQRFQLSLGNQQVGIPCRTPASAALFARHAAEQIVHHRRDGHDQFPLKNAALLQLGTICASAVQQRDCAAAQPAVRASSVRRSEVRRVSAPLQSPSGPWR